MAEVTDLFYYPVKSCAGTSVTKLNLSPTGPLYDRHWMLIDDKAKFVSQRAFAKMALIRPSLKDDFLFVEVPDREAISLGIKQAHGEIFQADIWRSQCDVIEVSKHASEYLSDFLNQPVKLVRMADNFVRKTNPKRGPGQVAFADGYPFLITSESSLDELNGRLSSPIPMQRFRSNIVIKGAEAYAEDLWKTIVIGQVRFRVVKPCSRCVMTTIDQTTGKATSKEPLVTLSKYRNHPDGVLFGMNLIHNFSEDEKAFIEVGDQVVIED